MRYFSRCVAAAVLVIVVQADAGFAQSTSPAATTPPAASSDAKPADTKSSDTKSSETKPLEAKSSDEATDKPVTSKKKKTKKMTRQQEIDKSVDSGTVPARYRSSVPKEYHQYIPFAK
jgi:cytoskeletal protein RodZ